MRGRESQVQRARRVWAEFRALRGELADARAGIAAEARAREQLQADLVAQVRAREELEAQVRDFESTILEQIQKASGEAAVAHEELAQRINSSARQSTVTRLERAVARLEVHAAAAVRHSGADDAVEIREPLLAGTPGHARSQGVDDRLYLAIEDALRGDADLIKAWQTDYAVRIADLLGGSGRVVDLGCGRGEFIQAAAQAGLRAVGVDMNEDAVAEVQAAGHSATVGDALGYLAASADQSIDAITMFHVVEHLSFEVLTAVLRQAHRVLRPGGLLVLETPNAQTVSVGAHTFWLDPTHLRPVPRLLLETLLGHTGFTVVDVLLLHPYPELAGLDDDARARDTLMARVADAVLGPQDLGMIARRDEESGR